jgi:molybdopterin biosynthesis enzyme
MDRVDGGAAIALHRVDRGLAAFHLLPRGADPGCGGVELSAVQKAIASGRVIAVRRNAAGGLEVFPNQSSGVLTSLVWGDGLVNVPPGRAIARGDMVSYISFSELLA